MNEFLEYAKESLNWSDNANWITQIFIVVLVTLVASFIVNKLLIKLEAKLEQTHNNWDDAIIKAFRKPARVLIWVVGIAYAGKITHQITEAPIFEAVGSIRDVLVIVVLAWGLIRFINNVQENIYQKAVLQNKKIDATTSDAISNILKVSIGITSFIIILQTLGFSIQGVLAFGGVGGIAIGFAAKDLLANFFGALMIYLDKPFKIGDWVRSPDRDIEGTVEKIGWRLTIIRTFDKRPLYVPNSVFSNIAVENPSRMKNRRIYDSVGVRYDDMKSVGKIVEQIKNMLESHQEIDSKQTLIVNLNKFNNSSVDIMVYTFTKTTDWIKFHEVKQDVMLKIAEIIDDNGAEIAYPTQTLHVDAPQFEGAEQNQASKPKPKSKPKAKKK